MNITGRAIAPKPDKLTPAERRAGKKHIERVKQLPCVICLAPPPSDAHHVIHDRFSFRKASDMDVIPLCKVCHQDGPEAIHNGKATWREKHGPDYGFIPVVRAWLADGEIDF